MNSELNLENSAQRPRSNSNDVPIMNSQAVGAWAAHLANHQFNHPGEHRGNEHPMNTSNNTHTVTANGNSKIQVGNIYYNYVDGPRPEAQLEGEAPPAAETAKLVQRQREMFVNSLRPDQDGARYAAIKLAYSGTCEWLLREQLYRDWLDPAKLQQHHGFLWIKGKPGAGKSTLMKFALGEARTRGERSAIIHFFFHARGHSLEKSTNGMYRSLLWQLFNEVPRLQKVYDPLKNTWWNGHKVEQWPIEPLKELFKEAIQLLGQHSLVCFIDALDECDEDQIRDMLSFLEEVCEKAVEAGTRFRVCFSSRHYPHITFRTGLTLILEGQEGHDRDITRFVEKNLKIGSGSTVEQIKQVLRQKASGVFMWIVLVIGILNKDFDRGNILELRQRLQEMPNSLRGLFRDVLERDGQGGARLLLCIQWLLFAHEPLTPVQLYFAILSNLGSDEVSRQNPITISEDDVKRSLLNSSKGLAEITRSDRPIVQFIHESVRDFILKDDGLSLIWLDHDANFEARSHEQLKQGCISYMKEIHGERHPSPILPTSEPDLTRVYPFVTYAVLNVLHHANLAQRGGIDQRGFVGEFHPRTSMWQRCFSGRSLLYSLAEGNLFHLIAIHPSILSYLEVEHAICGTPLFAALANGSHDAVDAFLTAEKERHQSNELFQTMCDVYFQNERERVYDLGFRYSEDQGVDHYLAKYKRLAYALACIGYVKRERPAYTVFLNALEEGHVGVALLLIEDGRVNINTRYNGGRTPFMNIVIEGCEEIVRQLLASTEVDVDKTDNCGRTPLAWAARKGHTEIVKLILQTGNASVHSTDEDGHTCLMLAARQRNEKTVKLLLQTGSADINRKCKLGHTALGLAAELGHEEIVKLLLAVERVDVNVEDDHHRTPLFVATTQGYESIVRLLLASPDIEINTRDHFGQTPLFVAAKHGHEDVVKLLLAVGRVDINVEDNGRRTPLFVAARKGYKSIVRLLLATRDIEVNTKDSIGHTPLFVAARYGYEDVVKLLLDTGKVNIGVRDAFGNTPEFWASLNGHKTIVETLRLARAID